MDPSLPIANPSLAKSVWQNQKRPSARSVARAMTAAGYPIHYTTVARWKRQGWPTQTDDVHPLDKARAALDSVAPLLTGDPMTKADDLICDGSANETLERLSDAEHLRRSARELSILLIRMHEQLAPRLGSLMSERLGELALFIRAFVACGEAANAAALQAECMERGPAVAVK